MSLRLCLKPVAGRSRFESLIDRKCYKAEGHKGRCLEYPYLLHLDQVAPRVSAKIKRDATKTTGAAWKSADAGPNRIDRWVMTLSDEELLKSFGIDMKALKPTVQAKLREKAASYDDCMDVAAKLAASVYGMLNSPDAPEEIYKYLTNRIGKIEKGETSCIVCKDQLNFNDFEQAQRGRALIETAHSNPRFHNASNVGFAHRECNIAQGSASLEEFYDWIRGILKRVDK